LTSPFDIIITKSRINALDYNTTTYVKAEHEKLRHKKSEIPGRIKEQIFGTATVWDGQR